MSGDGLSPRERTILSEIEQDLRGDAVLARRLRTMRRGPRPWTGRPGDLRHHRTVLAAVLLGGLSCALFGPAVTTSQPALVGAFALTWTGTLACAVTLLCRWCGRMSRALEARPPGPGPRQPEGRDGA
ncbi:DUF3040 domain-containing protein [Streptomyces sp. NPDC012888]|uniref:DUF3040 domain-containing protein n=1 Tax=Streptomyces sp. NPDC012888 TaxID=3364855 RepID=UPI00368A61A2